jgi:transcription elongation factor GreA
MKKVYLTKEGKEKLEAELDYLIKVEHKELIQALSDAREKGDISENAEYESAKTDLETLSIKVSKIQDTLSRVEVISKSTLSDSVSMLSSISIRNKKTNQTINWTLVPENEVNIKEGKISFNSPVGSALLGRKVGELVKIQVPAGEMEVEVLEIN